MQRGGAALRDPALWLGFFHSVLSNDWHASAALTSLSHPGRHNRRPDANYAVQKGGSLRGKGTVLSEHLEEA